MSILSIEFSPESLHEIVRFGSIPVMLSAEVQKVLQKGAERIVVTARANMHWKHPTGKLERSMTHIVKSLYAVMIGSDLPYARRRHDGFDGPDSLGRVYHDKSQPFLAEALAQETRPVLILFDDTLENLFGGL